MQDTSTNTIANQADKVFDPQKLLDDMVTFVAVLDTSGTIIFVNNTPLKVIDKTLEEVKGSKFWDISWWAYSQDAINSIRKDIELCAAGKSLLHEIQLATADGTLIWIEYGMHPILSDDGEVEYLVPEGRDITDKKRQEKEKEVLLEEVRQQKDELETSLKLARFETFFEHSIDGVLIIENYKFVDCNQKIVEMLRCESKDEVFDTHPSKFSPKIQPDGRSSFEKAEEMIDLALEKNGHQFEWMYIRSDGEDFWAEVTLVPMKHNGNVILQCVWREITDKKNMESALEQSKRRLDRVLEGTKDGYWEWNLQTNEMYYSTQWKAMLGYQENEITFELSEWEKLVHLDDVGEIWEKIQQHLAGKITQFTDELRMLCKDGTYKWIHTRGSITEFTQLGKPLIMSGTHIDISDRKILEKNLQEEKEKLLAQNILLKEKDELMYQQSRLAQMGEMISMIAHQWRQPLSAISMTAATVQVKLALGSFDTNTEEGKAKKDEYLGQQLSIITGFVRNLSDTIDDFRNFYKPNKEVVSIKLSDIISKSLSVIESSLNNNNITINITDKVDRTVDIYNNELMQVVLNLLKNAQDNFLEKDTQEATIDIDITNTSIKILDNGGGIEEEIFSKIFDPYFSTKDEKNGTGLGLYMSKIIIEDHHNGKLTVENTGSGACFTIALQVGGGL